MSETPTAVEETVAIEEEIVVVEEPKYMTINGYVELNLSLMLTITFSP